MARTKSNIHGREGIAGWVFTTPMIIVLGLFLFVPVLMAFWVSLTNWAGNGDPFGGGPNASFVGVSNYTVSQFETLQHFLPFPIATHQPELSCWWLEPFRNGVLDQCMRNGATPLAWSPLLSRLVCSRLVRGRALLRSVSDARRPPRPGRPGLRVRPA